MPDFRAHDIIIARARGRQWDFGDQNIVRSHGVVAPVVLKDACYCRDVCAERLAANAVYARAVSACRTQHADSADAGERRVGSAQHAPRAERDSGINRSCICRHVVRTLRTRDECEGLLKALLLPVQPPTTRLQQA